MMQLNRGVYWHRIRTSLADWAGVACRVGRPSWYCTAGGLNIRSLNTYSPLLLIRWDASQVFFFFPLQRANWLAQHFFQKWNYGGSPKIEASTLKYRVPSLWPTYVGERRTTFAKASGIKVRCYGEHVGEHIGNWGTYWKPGKKN
jgi:hypothetical protein